MKRVVLAVLACLLSVGGVATATYFIDTVPLGKPCEYWKSVTVDGQTGYVCDWLSFSSVDVPDAYDVTHAIDDMDYRIGALENEIATLKKQMAAQAATCSQ